MPTRLAPTWIVTRNGVPAPELQPLKVQRSLNGDKLDYAELMVDTNKHPNFNGLDDFDPTLWLGHFLDIRSSNGPYVHRGEIISVNPRFNQGEAAIHVISRTEHHQFGEVLYGQRHWNPVTGEFAITDDDLLFNPTIDGITRGNKHNARTFGSQQVPIFLHPEAVRTSAARNLHGGDSVSWTLSEVLYYLCWFSNTTQTFLVNPTLAELQSVVVDSVDFVRNLKIKAGSTLPEALDATLTPMGYLWRLTQIGTSFLNKIELIRRATGGRLVWLNHQRMGSTLNTLQTNTEAVGVRFDSSRLANRIIAKGGKLQVEITAALHRGWPADLDDEPLESLAKSAAAASENPQKKDAWRKWVLNEAGDYIGTRPEITGVLNQSLYQSLEQQDLLKWFPPRRRKFLPTLTLNNQKSAAKGDANGLVIEYRDYDGEWKAVPDWGIETIETECGLYIRAENVPEQLYDQGEAAALRVTATIESEFRITHFAEKQADSPLFSTKTEYLDLADGYQYRTLLTGSKFAAGSDNLIADDYSALQSFADSLRNRFDQLDIPGGITLEGVEWLTTYLPGDRVAGVRGKNISFQVKKGTDQYPQIVAITLDIAAQKTILQLQRFREFRAS